MATTTYGSPYVENTGLVSAWPGVSLNVAQRIDSVSYSGNGINAQTGTTYTLVLTDAGKNVTLSNASAVTVTVPTFASVAYPVGTVINLTNLGAGTVTVAAAGTVTVNGSTLTLGQYTKGQLLNTATNTWVFTSGPTVTSPGLVLITPTSIANSGGTATASGGAVTLSGVTSVSLNGVFTSSYDNYDVIFSNASSASGNVVVYVRLRASGTDATGGNYNYQRQSAENSTGYLSYASAQTQFTGPQIAATAEQNGIWLRFLQPQLARRTVIDSRGGYQGIIENYYGGHTLQTSYDGLTIYPSSSSISGTLRVYGYNN